MVKEDFTTYTETDPNSHITVAQYQIDAKLYRNEDAYVVKDFGIDHFGDFEHWFEIIPKDTVQYGQMHCAVISDYVDDILGLKNGGHTALTFLCYESGDLVKRFILEEFYQGGEYVSNSFVWTANIPYFLVLKKIGLALTCDIYSDLNRTVKVDTLTLTLHADHKLRYAFGVCSLNSGEIAYYQEATILDLEFKETGQPPPPPSGKMGIIAVETIPPLTW